MNLSGNPFDYIVAFLGGVLVSFTPCVYPLIPVCVGFIGIKARGSKIRGFFLSFFYVTGVAITYSLLGLFASLTGTIFGRISSSPITYLFVGVVIIFFGLSLLDLFTISLPALFKMPVYRKQGYFTTFLLGLTSGLIVSPCLTPILGSIFVYLTTKKNLFYGATLLLSFAYGMGLVLILAGTFSAILMNLPKSGKWMLSIKKAFSLILIGTGLYFIYIGFRRM